MSIAIVTTNVHRPGTTAPGRLRLALAACSWMSHRLRINHAAQMEQSFRRNQVAGDTRRDFRCIEYGAVDS